jgi:DNA-binding transcriptional LysR family regulator
MDLRQLEALVAVAEHGRFSAAARALNTVQSNISTHIARLENELQTILVDRSAGQLTPEGEVVVARARRVHAELQALTADVASMTSHVTGQVALGVIGTTGRWVAPLLLDEMHASYPGVRLSLVESTTSALIPLLVDGQVDLAVINTPINHPELLSRPLFEEDLVMISPANHELASSGDREVTLAELAKHSILLGPVGSHLRTHIDAAATAAATSLKAKAEIDGVRLTATLAFQGYGPAIVPSTAIPTWAQRGDWAVLTLPEMPPRLVGLVSRRRGMLSTAASHTRDVFGQVVREHAGSQTGIRTA